MNLIFYDGPLHKKLLPLTFTRPVSKLRVGILTIEEKWIQHLAAPSYSYITQPYLSKKYPLQVAELNYLLLGGVCPNPEIIFQIRELEPDSALIDADNTIIAACITEEKLKSNNYQLENIEFSTYHVSKHQIIISRVPDLFLYNEQELKNDFNILTTQKKSAPISSTNQIIGNKELIFAEPGAKCECAILNTQNGPIYLGKNSEIMEGCLIRGGLSLGQESQIKMGAKIYGATTIGPHCKVGGEINNSIILGYSNKAHDGFLGNSVIGEWCNLGADTNNSNLKNNYDYIKIWNYEHRRMENTGLQFCGLIMGDHSKAGINTMFNTGTTVGVCCNIFGGGFPPTFIPSFAWGGAQGLEPFMLNKAFEMIKRVMARRNQKPSELEFEILEAIHKIDSL
jgi:UDP-N-acetylglucosamine diphosphorylase/glucosamine-1-phosphate N-acetyltransferase